jgi:ribosomal protein S12 methylthiotransferase
LYSTEPLTPAAKTPDTVPIAEKKARRDAMMLAQREVSRKRTKARIGQKIELLVDGQVAESPVKGAKTIARSQLEAPEVDGVVYVKGRAKLSPGDIVKAEVVDALDYDLVAKI